MRGYGSTPLKCSIATACEHALTDLRPFCLLVGSAFLGECHRTRCVETTRVNSQQALSYDYSPWTFWNSAPDAAQAAQREYQEELSGTEGSSIGKGAFLARTANIDTDSLTIGTNSYIAAHAYVTGRISIGSDCSVNAFTVVRGAVSMGNGVRIGAHTSILGFNHSMDPDEPVFKQPLTSKGIIIGDDVWIGSNVVVLDGVRVGSHAVLAAGAVVTKDVPEWSVVGGNPARRLRDRRDSTGTRKVDDGGLRASLAAFAAMARADATAVLARSWNSGDGGWYADQPGREPTVRAQCDAIEVADLLLGTAPPQLGPVQHTSRLRSLQDPVSGLVPGFQASPETPRFGSGDATYHVLSVGYALDLLGSGFEHDIHAVTETSPESLLTSLDALPWVKEPWEAGAWVDAWGTAAYWNLARKPSAPSTALQSLFGWLTTHVSASSGTWGTPGLDTRLKVVNGYYRLARGTFAQFGLPVPHAERLVDTVLLHAADQRYFGPDRQNACNVLDVIHPLWLAGKQTAHRGAEIQAWAKEQLVQALTWWRPCEGMAFSAAPESGNGFTPGLQGTEMWLAIIWYLADVLGHSEALGYRPRGVHRPEPAYQLPTL